ncbi:UDP-glycosyltransferase 75D1 [Hibiscus syriacus]|uniref:Glycosyltransferase n=1 Tax=Hibiscus syriacus TaxID=106335 RepID=A0A6A3BIB8_HIBSY|nr:phloretin 4'-O-glucosyltransferase-like [Hibiscus syriacus]KAE8714519.1 UDP-glycosyltransferase 75D1 [Hibiscus syriacus]
MPQPHFLLLTYPAQGHINPSLQFAKHLIRIGVRVTFITTISASRRMTKVPAAQGLSFSPFSDGYDDGIKPGDDPERYLSEFRRRGKEALSDLIITNENEGKPITCIIYSLLLTWAAEGAREHHIPSALLWIQPTTVFDIYYFYFNGYESTIKDQADESNSKSLIKLPGLPPLATRDLPSFFSASNVYNWGLSMFQEQMEVLYEEPNAKILVNTFDALEPEALKAIDKFKMIAFGPLIPSSFLKDQLDSSLRTDLFQCDSNEYLQWLDSKQKSSVVYVSFGSMSVLAKQQVEEIARALIDSGRPFLWVVRNQKLRGEEVTEEDKLSCREEIEQFGMIVPWCSQVEVLSHPSLGCFVSHCGWNSTLESLVAGVPVVAFPQWTDQGTNAKLIEDVWKTGVRVSANEEGIVERGEFVRCLDLTMGDGEKGEEVRRNAEKWRDLAREAAVDGGSLDMNLKAFVDDVTQGCK